MRGRDLAGVGALGLGVHVLGADGDVRAGEGRPDGRQRHVGRADDADDAGHVGGVGDGAGQRAGVRWGGVHLPVGGDDDGSHGPIIGRSPGSWWRPGRLEPLEGPLDPRAAQAEALGQLREGGFGRRAALGGHGALDVGQLGEAARRPRAAR